MPNTVDGAPSKSSADASSLGDHPAPVPAASAHRPILSFGGRGPYSARGRGRGRGRGTIHSGRGSGKVMVSSPGHMSRRGRGRGSAKGVSAGSNSWRRGQPSTTNSAGTFASSNSWVRPKDDNTVQKKDAKKTEKAVSAVDLALASIEDNANDKEEPMVPPQNKTVSTDAIDGNNTDGTSKSKALLEKAKLDQPPKKRPKKSPQPKISKPNKDYDNIESNASVEVDMAKIDSLRRNVLDYPPKKQKPILKGAQSPLVEARCGEGKMTNITRMTSEQVSRSNSLHHRGTGKWV